MSMKLIERLNVLIQAATLSQKSGSLTLDEAAKAKSAIDLLSAGTLNQNYASAINVLIELAIASQKKGAYSLKDAYMIYLAIEGIESEFQNEVNRITGNPIQEVDVATSNAEDYNPNNQSSENVIVVPPKKLKRKS